MESSLSLQNFQKNGTRIWAINCQQRTELLFSTQAPETSRVQASVEWGGLRRDRAHGVNNQLFKWYNGGFCEYEATGAKLPRGP
ncbi:hypothetical protein AVEN_143096-1 [Araneus ventricosus]|uniref:Uncharacterized protein n=1 Tax=Araneus ventricosus TaxID=182803 RepID=A0A4Y2L4E8_ARAVE|nr:hypothetical protein AVEN_143096-1 [Araneus ventricosus]